MPTIPQWQTVDEGWGRKAVDFATLGEPASCREYVALHEAVRLTRGDRLLDLACGAGLALELGAAQGAVCSGVDASPRLVAVARDRLPTADLRVGDMNDLPWGDSSFDVVTSFRGIWGTTPHAVVEARRVLEPGGRLGLTVWGHIKASPGAWALKPFTLAAPEKVANQAQMVGLGRPGAGERLLQSAGFTQIVRHEIPFVWEFPDPAGYARTLASMGPAYEAIQSVGEQTFLSFAEDIAYARVRDGLPLRAEINVVGLTARAPAAADRNTSRFLSDAPPGPEAQALFDEDVIERGYVMNATRLWARDPQAHSRLFDLLGHIASRGHLSLRDRGVLVTATASTLGDPYCSLAWGQRLAEVTGAEIASDVLTGAKDLANPRDQALATWARTITRDPNSSTPTQVNALRAAGLSEDDIFAATVYVGLRIAFSTINDALGATPDDQLRASTPDAVRNAVENATFHAMPGAPN
jgi:SAM-dependent methyltransferase/alkylhydroperoxidase family enzyme